MQKAGYKESSLAISVGTSVLCLIFYDTVHLSRQDVSTNGSVTLVGKCSYR